MAEWPRDVEGGSWKRQKEKAVDKKRARRLGQGCGQTKGGSYMQQHSGTRENLRERGRREGGREGEEEEPGEDERGRQRIWRRGAAVSLKDRDHTKLRQGSRESEILLI
ncbi:hypothetical protein Mp_8g02550 [Marchantia polymorpha subsp. ruderalis]|uniref:Uncharacterized protein n=1 Tax=Marchantia polymorpha TaxID=3197 RepID=A0A2R6XJ04_MARPO|nr:hypothetical protein MARPO_0012s0052 [Marchantia polymorpha]BBN18447.1 hypothetical protein Mp_8g02550 [Marchantia polymorpha subsp. ruderalis]|eukprot:PTQ46094.1 hypothetical protein MARPO_0012s0052 [Marchantia polymorpha]